PYQGCVPVSRLQRVKARRNRGDRNEQAVPAECPPPGVEELVDGHPQVGEREQQDVTGAPDRREITGNAALHQEGEGDHHPDEPGEDVEHRDLAALDEQRRRLGSWHRNYRAPRKLVPGSRLTGRLLIDGRMADDRCSARHLPTSSGHPPLTRLSLNI